MGTGYDVYSDGQRVVYLTVVVDWASRKVLAAKVAITLETCHAVDVLQEAITRYGTPDIFNTAMIGSSVCRFRVMGLLLSAHHRTV